MLICGYPFRLVGEDSPARAAIAEMLRCLPRADCHEYCTLSVHQLEQHAALQKHVPAWLLAHLANLPEGDAVHLVYASDGGCAALAANTQARYCAWLSADSRQIHYIAQKRSEGLTPLSVSSVLVPVLREFFAVQGAVLLHAAAVQMPAGHGMLLLAESGGGKTTTALALLRSGARLLADDLVLVQPHDDALRIHGIAEALNLTAQTMAFFPEIEAAANKLPDQTILPNGKRILAADAIYPDAYQHKPCQLHAICSLRVQGEQPLLHPMPVQQAFGLLLHAHTFAKGQRQSRAALDLCSAALAAVPVFTLSTGADPQRLGPWLMNELRSLRPQEEH